MVISYHSSNSDIVVIGYGPVGRMLALKLGLAGHSVLVVERQASSYFLPRAVHLDDEAARILQSVGASPADMPDSIEPYDDFYEWRAADYTTLVRLDWRGRGPSGWNVSNFFNQPGVERHLDQKVRNIPGVQVLNGWKAVDYAEGDDSVAVELLGLDGEQRTVSGKYVIGADGANSVVGGWIGGETSDLGYFRDWLVVDLIMKESMTFDPPAWQLCDPQRPTTLVPGGPGRRRFEFMRLDDESLEELGSRDKPWSLLEPWGIGIEQADLERSAVYTFQAKWKERWRRGRLLIAGDSAHLMPPFAGQGMCSGLRDAANLAWKLDLVLDGVASDEILDSYGQERKEHVRHFIEASMGLGDIICISDPVEAAARDSAMKAELGADTAKPPRPLPRLGDGIHRNDAAGGTLSIQGIVDDGQHEGLLDDVIGGGGFLLVWDPARLPTLTDETRIALDRVGFRVVRISPDRARGDVHDVEGRYEAWFSELGATAALVRPDFYVYGVTADPEGLTVLVEAFLTSLSISTLA